MDKKRILVTGSLGFIGHHFVNHILVNTDWDVVCLDALTYASEGFDRLRDINVFDDKRVNVVGADLARAVNGGVAKEIGEVDYIVHMAAETHVDNSIEDARPFVIANVLGTYNILEFARTQPILKQFIYFSTDEVFGPAPEGVHYKENDRYDSGNPYAATKAGGEELVMAYANTYNLPCIVTHTMNVFGERQHPEKYIPKVIKAVLNGDKVTIHANATKTKAGSRFWVHARNVASAILFLLNSSLENREKFNIVGEREVDNLKMAQMIAEALGMPLNYEMVDFHSQRPGHDLRYALDGTKMAQMGYRHPKNFETSLRKTIHWYLHPDNKRWLYGSQRSKATHT